MRIRSKRGEKRKLCSKCGKVKERLDQSYCNACHAEYMRLNRPRHVDLSANQRIKANARAYLNTYLKRGKVIKGNCVICGSSNSQAHHENYLKALEVVWYCRKHHLELHKK